jgi:hypothetical protein
VENYKSNQLMRLAKNQKRKSLKVEVQRSKELFTDPLSPLALFACVLLHNRDYYYPETARISRLYELRILLREGAGEVFLVNWKLMTIVGDVR